MYVKLVDQRGPTRIYRTGGETVELGSVTWAPDSQGGVLPHEADLSALIERIGKAADVYDRTLISPEPFGYKDDNNEQPFWRLRWARFNQVGGDACRLVITTGPLFVLGDNGKTIDRAA